LLFLDGRGPNRTFAGLGSEDLSSTNGGRSEESGGLLVASLRGGVGGYEEPSPPDMEAEFGAVLGSWMGGGEGNRGAIFSAGAKVCGIINSGAIGSFLGGGFSRVIRRGAGRGVGRVGMGVEVGSVDDRDEEKKR
jgi:hypothetical protein